MTDEEIKTANKTARSSGAVGKNALLPRIITGKMPYRAAKILDFGSGPKAIHTKRLREEGYTDVTPYEMGSNYDPKIHLCHINDNSEMYDIVFASNVINTLSSLKAIRETILAIDWYTATEGVALINLPLSPRKYKDLDKELLIKELMKVFLSVMVENHNGTRVFYCYKRHYE